MNPRWITVSERRVEGLPWFRADEVIVERRRMISFRLEIIDTLTPALTKAIEAFQQFGRVMANIIDVTHER